MNTGQQKQFSLVILMLIYSGLMFWYAAYNISVISVYPIVLVAGIIALTFWVALLTLALGLLESPIASITLIFGLPVMLVIVGRGSTGSIGAAIILGIILGAAQNRIRAEIKGRIKFHVFPTFFQGVRYVLFGLLVIIAGLSMNRIIDSFSEGGVQIPESYVVTISQPLMNALTGSGTSLLPQDTVDDVVDQQIEQAYPNLPPEEKLKLKEQVQSQSASPLGEINDQLPQMITSTVNHQLGLITRDNPVITAVMLLISLIIFSRIFIPIIAVPILSLMALIIIISRQLGLIFVIKTQETVERLKL